MHFVEDHRVLHPQRCELVDVEEAAVVDLFGCDTPVRQPVRLRVEKGVERVEASRHSGRTVDARDSAVDDLADVAAAVDQRRQPTDSPKKIAAPKVTTSGSDCRIAEALAIGIMPSAVI